MSKPRPISETVNDIREIRKLLPGLWRLLLEVEDFAFSSGGGAESGRGGSISDSDPTGDLAAAKGTARSKLRAADDKISAALSRLRETEDALHAAFLPKDHRALYEETFVRGGELDKGAVVHLSDVRAAEDAKVRRLQRGEM